jgi:hypothetical protein
MTSTLLRWALLEAGDDGSSLVIQYEPQRGTRRPAVQVVEDAECIEIELRAEILEPKPDTAWTTQISTPIWTIELASPIRGRTIYGYVHRRQIPWPYIQVLKDPGNLVIPGAPCVVGLAPEDAVEVLRYHGFDTQFSGAGSQVISQHPPRGEVPSDWDPTTPNRAGTIAVCLS